MFFIEGSKGTLGLTALAIVTTVLALLAVVLISRKIFGSNKKRSAGKRKELQRPFMKRKQASPRGKKWKRSFLQLADHHLLKNNWSNYNLKSDNRADKKNKPVHPNILSTVVATIRDSKEKDSPDITNYRLPLAPHFTDLVDTFDGYDDGISSSNATSVNSKYLNSDKTTFEGTVQNIFVLQKNRRRSASPPESRIGNLSNQSTGYLLGSDSASPNEFDHSYCQLRLYDSLQNTPSTGNIFDGEYDDMSVSLAWEELLSDDTTESSRSFKNSISSYTDMSQTSIGDELENRYRYSQSLPCHCPEMMTFGIKEMWAHKCNSLLSSYQGNTNRTVSLQENNHCESFESTNHDFDDVNNSEQKLYNSVDLKSHFSDEDCITSRKQSISSLASGKETHFSNKTVDSNTVTANVSLNQNYCSFSYCNHKIILQQKLGKDFTAFRDRVSSTNGNFDTLQRNHSQFDSRRWYSLGSLCDECHGCPNDVIKHDYAHTRGQDRVKVDLDFTPEPYNDTGYTSTAETDSPVKDNSEVETGSYDADCESDDNAESILVNGVVEKNDDDDEIHRSITSIGEAILIAEYAKKEWKGKTATAETMRKGYDAIPSCVNCQHLRQIRGDNYCAIRATLFQALLNNVPVLANYPDTVDLVKMPEQLLSKGLTWIRNWNFGNRIKLNANDIVKTLQAYLMAFVKEVDEVNSFKSESEKMAYLLSVFNKDFLDVELKLLEAVKFLMLCSAIDLYEKLMAGKTVPTFAMLMFARDTSPDPQGLLQEHLNHVGDSAGLEQVEMHLLGYTLNVVIKVIRPIQVEKEDFIAYYPSKEDAPSPLPSVTLIAEDDRHYNIIM